MSNKMDELLSGIKIGELIRSNNEKERKHNKWVAIIAAVSVIILVLIAVYAMYKILTPDDFDDEFEDDFEDNFSDFDEDDDDDNDIDIEEVNSIKDIKQVKASATDDTLDEDNM